MKPNTKVVCRTNRLYKNGKAPLFIRLTQGNKVKFISTGVAINPLYWDSDACIIKEECPEGETLQAKVDSKLASIHKQVAKLEILDLDVTLDALTPSNSNRFNPTLEECFEVDIEKFRQTERVNTIIKYNFTLSSIKKFCNDSIRLSHIDLKFLQDFELYLRNTRKPEIQKMIISSQFWIKASTSLNSKYVTGFTRFFARI